ncbi:unnamed protein product [Closterium sp. Naga37s-1]|nr:unnamed protein product [Closterium sp. Naga37s-1]
MAPGAPASTCTPSPSPRRPPSLLPLSLPLLLLLPLLLSSHLPLRVSAQGLVLVPPPPDDSAPIAAPPASRQPAVSPPSPHRESPRSPADVGEAYPDVSSLSIGLANSTIPSLEHADVEVVVPRRAGDGDEDGESGGGGAGGEGEERVEGGFESMDAMLQWAIARSDPEALKQGAKEVAELTPEELEAKRQHIRDVVEAMRMPSPGDLMRAAIAHIAPAAAAAAAHGGAPGEQGGGEEEHERVVGALHELAQLVEPVHAANDLHKLGGLATLGALLEHGSSEVRGMAALVVGKAAQNNRLVQHQVVDTGVLRALFTHLHSPQPTPSVAEDEHARLLFALSAAIRGHVAATHWFFRHGGVGLLARLLSLPSPRSQRRALFLLADLADSAGARAGGGGEGGDAEREKEGVRMGKGLKGEGDSEEASMGEKQGGEEQGGEEQGEEEQGREEWLADEALMTAVVGLLGGGEGESVEGRGAVWRRSEDGGSTWDLDMLDKAAAALHSLLAASPATRQVLLACCRPVLAVERVRAALQAHVGDVQRGGDEAEYEQEVAGRLASLLLALQAAGRGADARSH